MINISCNPRYKGMITKISRTMYFGKLPDELRAQHTKNLDVENRMIAATRPGVDDVEVFRLAQKLYAEHGYPDMWKNHHQGGPQSYTNGFYAVSESNHEIVQLNQIYEYNPTITGTKSEDGFLVTEEGPVFITYPIYFPKEVQVIDGAEYVRAGIFERIL
jgi:Xaa-Pro aminopeptidase